MPLKKRLIGVITVKNGWAVQSFGYRRHLPLGKPEVLAWNLDRWGVDEILVACIDRTRLGLGPDFDVIGRIAQLGLSTPLTYGGGIQYVEQAAAVIQAGAERLFVDAALHHRDRRRIRDMAALVGAQAMIAAFPLSVVDGEVRWYDYRAGRARPLTQHDLAIVSDGVVSETLVIDHVHEGMRNAFDMELVRRFPIPGAPLIVFGGVSEPAQLRALLQMDNVVAVGVGNSLNYREHAVQSLKAHASDLPLRPPAYSEEH